MHYYQYISVFLEVCKNLNFTKAGKSLGLTQAAVSRQIKLLEESLGEQLLIRSPKKVALTSRGESLFELWSSFEARVSKDFFCNRLEVLRVGLVEGMLQSNFYQELAQYQSRAQINIELVLGKTQLMIEELQKGDLDLVISGEQTQTGVLSSVRLAEEDKVLISASPIERVGSNKELLKACQGRAAILYSRSDPLGDLVASGNRYVQINSFSGVIELVGLLGGFAIVPRHVLPQKHSLNVYSWKSGKEHLFATTLNYDSMPEEISDFINAAKASIHTN